MGSPIRWIQNKMQAAPGARTPLDFLNGSAVAKAKQFLAGMPGYAPTPLRDLGCLARRLGLGGVYVKDESRRFGLNAFKVLGGSYAMAGCLARRLGRDAGELGFSELTSPAVKAKLGEITFATATDGNHGRGVAWAARMLGHKSVVYMPKGSSPRRLRSILAEGADASITALNYDDAVRMTAERAKRHGWIVVQDTAWDGYEEIPARIMQGYGVMADEALTQLKARGAAAPTHILIQAGVGSLAGAVQGAFAAMFPDAPPKVAVVESDQADCLYRSAARGDGRPAAVGGDMDTIMAGLACGEANRIAWEILRDYTEMFVSCPDWVAAHGMRLLGNPLDGDARVVSGESGAVTAGLLSTVMRRDCCREMRAALALDETSRVLLFSTEGDTDPKIYRSIVWDGAYANDPAWLK